MVLQATSNFLAPGSGQKASNNERLGVQASSQDSNVSIFTPSCAFPLSSSFSSWASDAFGSTHLLGTAITAYGWNASGSHILSAEHRQNSHGYYITLLSFNKPTNNNNNNKKKKQKNKKIKSSMALGYVFPDF